MTPIFEDRDHAGERLGDALAPAFERTPENLLVLGLPRGGAVVAAAVARRLGARLDLMLVRKLGAPGREELAIGAIADGGTIVLDDELIDQLGVTARELEHVIELERRELLRRSILYRGTTIPPTVRGARVIVVDDGMATGSTMKAALRALRDQAPLELVAASPVAPSRAVAELRREADAVFTAAEPDPFIAVGLWYRDFHPVTDDEVRELLHAPRATAPRRTRETHA